MSDWPHRFLEFDSLTIAVPEVDYPWISEWEWEAEEETGQVFRLQGGAPILLYHQILRRHQVDRLLYILSNEQLEKCYGDFEEAHTLQQLWEERMALGEEAGMIPPPPLETLGCALSGALHLYLEWYYAGLVYSYQSDPEGITPGQIFSRRRRGKIPYETLGDFFQELSGDWEPDEESPAGMIPMLYDDLMVRMMVQVVGLLLTRYNTKDPEEVWNFFEEREMPIGQMAATVHAMVDCYPLPSEEELRA